MKKTITLLVLSVLFFLPVTKAQKIGDDPVRLKYIQLPTDPLPQEFKTYSVSLYGSRTDFTYINVAPNTLLDKYTNIPGLQKVNNGGHFNIEVSVGNIRVLSEETVSTDKSKKDKDDNVIKWKEYSRIVIASLPIQTVIKDMNGNVLKERILSSEKKMIYGGASGASISSNARKVYKSSAVLSTNWRKDKASFITSSLRGELHSKLGGLRGDVVNSYGYSPRDGKYQILVIKKHDEEAKFAEMHKLVAGAFEGVKATDQLDGVKEKVAPAFEYWKGIQKKYDKKDKKERKLFHAASVNLARTSYWLDMLDVSKDYANEALTCDYKKNRSKGLLKDIERLEKSLSLNNVDNRRFSPDLEGVVAPDSGFKGGYEGGNIGGGSNEVGLEGYMVDRVGNKYEGTFIVPDGNLGNPTFGTTSQGGVQFHYTKNSRQVISDLNPNTVKRFGFNGSDYITDGGRSLGLGIVSSGGKLIYEKIYESSKITLKAYRIYRTGSKEDDTDNFVVIKKANKDREYNTGDVSFIFAFKKKMAALYEDCPMLSDMYINKELGNSLDDHIKAALLYTKECK